MRYRQLVVKKMYHGACISYVNSEDVGYTRYGEPWKIEITQMKPQSSASNGWVKHVVTIPSLNPIVVRTLQMFYFLQAKRTSARTFCSEVGVPDGSMLAKLAKGIYHKLTSSQTKYQRYLLTPWRLDGMCFRPENIGP